MLVHMPMQPEASKYRHFLIRTLLFHFWTSPLNSTSDSCSSMGPTSQANPSVVIQALRFADVCRAGTTSVHKEAEQGSSHSGLCGSSGGTTEAARFPAVAVQHLVHREEVLEGCLCLLWQQAIEDSRDCRTLTC